MLSHRMACHYRVARALLGIILLLQSVLAVSETNTSACGASASATSIYTSISLSTASSTLKSTSTSTAATESARSTVTPKTCNGHPEYCSRSYSNITFIGSHDSAFVGDLPQQNQNIGIKAQLDMGIRYLQVQTHHSILDKNVIELCHSSCFLEDAGPLKDYLVTIKKWLDGNPNEVVTLLLTNGDSLSITEFGDTFTSSGIKNYAYVPSSSPLPISDWPTLGDLISSGKRLVVFLDYGADTKKVNFIQDEFAYYFETAWGITDASFPSCSIDRPPDASAKGRMGLVNHFLNVQIFDIKVPARDKAGTTNAATGKGSIGAQADLCKKTHGRMPNVILADFVDKGEVIKAQNNLNGL